MVAMFIMTLMLLAFLGSFVQSRRVTESSVMHAAATSLVYGVIEQIKGFDYTTLVPSTAVDANAPVTVNPPYIRVRINQDQTYWLQTVYTASTDVPNTPKAPTGPTPASDVTAASLGAIDNVIGPLPLSTVSGTASQSLTMNIWLWVDEMPDTSKDVVQVKRVTLIYSYTINDGYRTRTIRDREIFIRTRYDQ